MAKPLIHLSFLLFFASAAAARPVYNVIDFGADNTAKRGSTKAFLTAWILACQSTEPAIIRVPKGKFLLGPISFRGPCNNKDIKFSIAATLVAPMNYFDLSKVGKWIFFQNVEGISITGGVLDGRGQKLWDCKVTGQSCPRGVTSMTFSRSSRIKVTRLTSINSQLFHFEIQACTDVSMTAIVIRAPDDSPNTDGIHVQFSDRIRIYAASIQTGDDCISMGPGTTNLYAEKISCGPGHGISIGSLANRPLEQRVENITMKSVTMTGTDNGLRIKSWARPTNGTVSRVLFQDVKMDNVKYPILIDQNYCPFITGCPSGNSGTKIKDVKYNHIRGTARSEIAVKFDCSPGNPCQGLVLQGVRLTYNDQPSLSYCKNAKGTNQGYVNPPSCLT